MPDPVLLKNSRKRFFSILLAVQTKRARLSSLHYQGGAAVYLQVPDAERARFAAEQAMVQTRRALALFTGTVNL